VMVAFEKCEGKDDDELPDDDVVVADIPVGLFTFTRGYYTEYEGSKAKTCQSKYEGEAHIDDDGTISFTSGGHDWQGIVKDDLTIVITREGVTNPRPRNQTAIYGNLYDANLYNGFCGQGFFQLGTQIGD
jgi:hypothetical protein